MADIGSAPRAWETTTDTSSPYELDGKNVSQKALRTFVDAGLAGDLIYIMEAHRSQDEWQWSAAVVTDASPDTYVINQVIQSSNSDAQVSWSSGTRDVFLFDPHGYSSGPLHTITIATTLDVTHKLVLANFSTNLAVTLPPVADFQGKDYIVKSINSGVATVTEDAGDTNSIEDTNGGFGSTLALSNTGEWVHLRSDGTKWRHVGGHSGSATIGDTVIDGTAGSVLFVDASGNLGQDNTNLYWDDANNRLGVGTSSPGAAVQINTTVGGDDVLRLRDATNSANARFYFSTPVGSPPDLNITSDRLLVRALLRVDQIEGPISATGLSITTTSGVLQGADIRLRTTSDNIDAFSAGTSEDTIIRPYTSQDVVIQDHSSNPLVTVLNGGNVGIGTTDPGDVGSSTFAGHNVHIKGAASENVRLTVESGASGGNPGIVIWDGNGGVDDKGMMMLVDGGIFKMNSLTDSLGNNVANAFVVDLGAGSVGINQTSPDGQLHADFVADTRPGIIVETADNSTGVGDNFSHVHLANTNGTANNFSKLSFGNTPAGAVTCAILGFTVDHGNNYGELAFSTRNATSHAERMRIDQDGNVGIGTTTPVRALHIEGATTVAASIELKNTANDSTAINFNSNRSASDNTLGNFNAQWDGTNVAAMQFQSGDDSVNKDDGYIRFLTGQGGSVTEKVRIEQNGNVGIGTDSPGHLFHITGTDGSTAIASIDAGVGADHFSFFINADHTYLRVDTNNSLRNAAITFESGATVWSVGKAFTPDNFVISTGDPGNSSEMRDNAKFSIETSGNVGINTNSPQSLLDVQGAAGAAGILTLATQELTVVDGDELGRINFNAPLESSGSDAILPGAAIWAEADATFDATTNSTDLVFGTATSSAAVERMRVLSDGGVVIDNITISGSEISQTGGSHLEITTSNGAAEIQLKRQTHVQITATTAFIVENGGGGEKFRVDTTNSQVIATADVGIGTTSPQSLLDVQGASGAAGILTLSTAETTVVDGDELGRINFNAPSEASGSDAILAGAAIWAEADATFDATTNNTELCFGTATSSAAVEQMRLDANGALGINTSDPRDGYTTSNLTVVGTAGSPGTIADGQATVGIKNGNNMTVSLAARSGDFIAIRFADTGSIQAGEIRYDHSTDRMSFDTATVTAMAIDSSQQVGIGTTSPGALLDVRGGAVFNEDGADADFRIEGDTDTQLFFVDAGNDVVCIGTTSPRSTNGSARKFNVETAGSASAASGSYISNRNDQFGSSVVLAKTRGIGIGDSTIVTDGDDIGAVIFVAADGTDLESNCAMIKAQIDGTPGANDVPGRLLFMTTADGAASATERMRIDNAGLVGINDTSPGAQLHVQTSGTGVIGQILQATASQTANLSEWRNSAGTVLTVVDENGYIGIGDTSPQSRLELAQGTTATDGITFGADTTLYRSAANSLKTDDAFFANTSLNSVLYQGSTGTPALAHQSSSDWYIGGKSDDSLQAQDIIFNNSQEIDILGERVQQEGTVSTTDATETTIGTYATANNTVYHVEATVVGLQTTDHSEVASYKLHATFKNDGGTLTQIGTTSKPHEQESTAAWDADIKTDAGTNILVRVTGAAATNIDWKVVWKVTSLS